MLRLLPLCELQRGIGCLWVGSYDGMIDFIHIRKGINFQMKWAFDERGFFQFLNLWTKADMAANQLCFHSLAA